MISINSLLLLTFHVALVRSAVNSYTPEEIRYYSFIDCIVALDRTFSYVASFVVLNHKIPEVGDDGDGTFGSIVESVQRSGVPVVSLEMSQSLAATSFSNVVAVVHVRSCRTFQQLIAVHNFTRLDDWKYLIVLSNFTADCIEYVDNFGHLTKMDHLSILIDGIDQITLWSFLPTVHDQGCHIEPMGTRTMINSCTDGFWEKSLIFPPKAPRDYKRCPLHVGLSNMFPFAQSDASRDLTPARGAVGCDVEVVKVVCDHLNFTPDFLFAFKHPENPYVSTDFLAYLANSSLDVCAGGFYRVFGDLVDYSGVYNRQVISFAYSIYREDRHWTNFVGKIWTVYIFVVFYACYAPVRTCAARRGGRREPLHATFLAGWGALTGGGGLPAPSTHRQRLLDCCYLIMCMHFSAYVGAKLFSFLTIQGSGVTYETYDEIMELDKKTYLSDVAKGLVQDDRLNALLDKAEQCAGYDECADQAILHRGLTVLLSGFFVPIQAATAAGDEARIMMTRDNILTVYHEMLLRKSALFVREFQRTVLRLVEAGVADRLYAEAIGTTVLARAEAASKSALADGYRCTEGCPISLPQIAGAFMLWAAGAACAAAAAVAEIVWFRRVNG